MRIILLFITLLPGFALGAQPNFPEAFTTLADDLNVWFDFPEGGKYTVGKTVENDYLPMQLLLRSRPEKLEHRLTLVPEMETDPYYGMPHLRTMTTVMNLQSNGEDAVTTVHSFDDEELASYGADWGRMYTFRPKRSYAARATVQLIVLYRQDRGYVYHALLFDKAPTRLTDRHFLVGFREKALN